MVIGVKKITKQVLAAIAAGGFWWPPGQVIAAVNTEGVAAMQQEIDSLRQRLVAIEKQLARVETKGAPKGKKEEKQLPTLRWSGSAKIGYMYDDKKAGKVKTEIRLNALTEVDGNYDVGLGVKFKSTSAGPVAGKYPAEKNKVKLDQAYVGRSFGPMQIKAGVQNVVLGEGLWLAKSGSESFYE